ncbi:hypothetical protein RHMOL_Rhmol08G0143900 [Rhododendron molle]|uniref:Uncharacterized protein n=1 Tax=Rhododendron molle TaxID=49168 RepID=A0ACC0MQD9_RHOML|nr:hypothetical protein RHMOL_Rhmol08G0143900 [Rhododendron molle]
MCDALFDWDFPYSGFDSDSDSDSKSCNDKFGLIQLVGDKKPDMELPPSGSPRAYSWSDDDSGCDDDEKPKDRTVPVEKSDGFDVYYTYRMGVSEKTIDASITTCSRRLRWRNTTVVSRSLFLFCIVLCSCFPVGFCSCFMDYPDCLRVITY